MLYSTKAKSITYIIMILTVIAVMLTCIYDFAFYKGMDCGNPTRGQSLIPFEVISSVALLVFPARAILLNKQKLKHLLITLFLVMPVAIFLTACIWGLFEILLFEIFGGFLLRHGMQFHYMDKLTYAVYALIAVFISICAIEALKDSARYAKRTIILTSFVIVFLFALITEHYYAISPVGNCTTVSMDPETLPVIYEQVSYALFISVYFLLMMLAELSIGLKAEWVTWLSQRTGNSAEKI